MPIFQVKSKNLQKILNQSPGSVIDIELGHVAPVTVSDLNLQIKTEALKGSVSTLIRRSFKYPSPISKSQPFY